MAREKGGCQRKLCKLNMNSQTAADMAKDIYHVQWTGKEYIPSELLDECQAANTTGGEVPARKMQIVYLMYHTMSPELAIDCLKESNNQNN